MESIILPNPKLLLKQLQVCGRHYNRQLYSTLSLVSRMASSANINSPPGLRKSEAVLALYPIDTSGHPAVLLRIYGALFAKMASSVASKALWL